MCRFSSIMSKLAAGLDIRCNHEVVKIDYQSPRVKVHTVNGQVISGDAVLVTVPLGFAHYYINGDFAAF